MSIVINPGVYINKRYFVKKLLAQGGMGNIYLVEDNYIPKKEVALKIIKPLNINSPDAVIRFKNEYEIMTKLKHPNLIEVFSFGYDESRNLYYITMENLHGQTLQDIIDTDQNISFESKVDIFIQLLRGLEFIHSRNIIYRDIKPSNIFITGNHAKFLDFGLSDHGELNQNKIKGSFLYLAPEIFKKDADRRIDIFALGNVFLELLTGNTLADGKTIKQLITIYKNENLFYSNQYKSITGNCPENAKNIILKMTAYDKRKRYQSCMEIINDINTQFGFNYPFETPKTKQAYIQGINFTDRRNEFLSLKHHILSNEKTNKVFLLSGNMGLGKSMIFNELKKYCQLNNILFFSADCYVNTANVDQPNYIIMQIIEQVQFYHKNKPLILDKLSRKNMLNNKKIDKTKKIAYYNQSLINYILQFVVNSNRTSVLYINNINWIDDDSFSILESLISILSDMPSYAAKLRLFASIRHSHKKNFISKITKQKFRKYFVLHTLKPFKEKDVKEYFYNAFGRHNLGSSLKENIKNIRYVLGGNPYFLSEFTKYCLRTEIIQRSSDKWIMSKNIHELIIPANIKDILTERLKLFMDCPLTKKILEVFSLLRVPVSMEIILSFFNSYNSSEVRSVISGLEKAEILSYKKHNKLHYMLSHNLIKEILTELVTEKKDLHLLIAENLENLKSDAKKDLIFEIEHHYSLTDKIEKRIYYSKKCGDYLKDKYFKFDAIFTMATKFSWILLNHEHFSKAS